MEGTEERHHRGYGSKLLARQGSIVGVRNKGENAAWWGNMPEALIRRDMWMWE